MRFELKDKRKRLMKERSGAGEEKWIRMKKRLIEGRTKGRRRKRDK